MEWMEYLHTALEVAVDLGIMLFEWVGVAVLVVSGVLGVVHYIRRDPETRLKLAQGLPWPWNSSWAARFSAPWWCGT